VGTSIENSTGIQNSYCNRQCALINGELQWFSWNTTMALW